MVEKNPFEKVLEQVASLLETLNDKQGEIIKDEKLPDDISEQLDQLETGIELFKKITDEALERTGVGNEELARSIEDLREIRDRKDKRVVKRAKKMREELDEMEKNLGAYARAARLGKKMSKKKKKRKTKFKRLGGDDKGWMPL